ncbi:DUF3426 domain-containing protein [Pseudomonas cavernicola]|uniref:DUF3426 domain-containing protein n=1 Tax=Pseudomonas cavernicola TaxID=2320866 RepID=A0A418XLG6_9PSED|nr:DUF3426 domain-containing protein [Pseudomonas cavernicola]RJG13291.1 DUF3426 domain-containing protein [Pseudomonas cavernicola]
MTASFVTQCPHCRTSFRVSRAQLGAAHGAVRCGACLHVFNAAQQLLGAQPAVAKAAASPPPTTAQPPRPATPASQPATPPGKAASDTLWIHDDLDLDSLDEELAKLEQQELQLSQEFLALEPNPKSAENLLKAPEKAREQHDESWTEALLKDEPASRPARVSAAPTAPLASTVAPPPVAAPPAEVPPSSLVSDEPALARDNADATNEGDDEELEHDFKLSAERDKPDVSLSATDDHDDQDNSFASVRTLQNPGRSEPGLRDDGLFNLAEEPLQLDWQERRKPWGRWLGWGLLNLIGAVALASQYIAYHFDELARQDQYRPWFEQFCPSLGCSLPSKVEISLIKSSNLVVRSHPEFTGALVVDAILYNRASFAQPFPLLEIRFADINGQLLASRRFKPSEYLAGELAGQAEMPPQTPIHISLDILDPGTKAVNYSLSFHSPE